LLDLVGRTKVH